MALSCWLRNPLLWVDSSWLLGFEFCSFWRCFAPFSIGVLSFSLETSTCEDFGWESRLWTLELLFGVTILLSVQFILFCTGFFSASRFLFAGEVSSCLDLSCRTSIYGAFRELAGSTSTCISGSDSYCSCSTYLPSLPPSFSGASYVVSTFFGVGFTLTGEPLTLIFFLWTLNFELLFARLIAELLLSTFWVPLFVVLFSISGSKSLTFLVRIEGEFLLGSWSPGCLFWVSRFSVWAVSAFLIE